MADLAVLGIQIESSEAEVADKRLDDFAASAMRAEKATDALASGAGRSDGAIARMVRSIEVGVRDLVAMGQAQLIMAQHAQQAATATNALAAANDHLGREAGGAGAAVRQMDSHVDAFRATAAAAAQEARALAAAEKQAASAAAEMASRAAALRNSVDPVAAAIDKVNRELRESANLYRVGAISAADYGRANDTLTKRLAGLTDAHGKGVKSAGAMQQATLNLTRQFADVSVTAAMGMNPLMILIQQGPQIADAFQMAGTQGLGFKAVLAGIYAQITPILVILAPLILAVGAVTAAFALMTRSMNQDSTLKDSLNLTEEQLKKLKKEGEAVTITMGDSFKALGTTIKQEMQAAFGDEIKAATSAWNKFLDELTANTGKEVVAVIGFFISAYRVIVNTWNGLPAAFSDLAVSAANGAIRAFNMLIAKSVEGINNLRAQYNKLPGILRGGQTAPTLGTPQLGEIANSNAGASRALDAANAEAIRGGRAAAQSWADGFAQRWERNSGRTAAQRIRAAVGDEADKASNDRAESLARELDALEATTKANYELARAYEVSGEEAMRAAARAEAVGKAIRRQGDIEQFVAAQLALNASKEAVTGAKKLRDVLDQTDALARLNAEVAAGNLTSDQANRALQNEAVLRPLIAAAATQEGERKAYLLELIQKLTGAQEELNRQQQIAALAAQNQAAENAIETIQRETELLGASNLVRAVTLAQLAKEQELRAKGVGVDTAEYAEAVASARALAAAQVAGAEATARHNAGLTEQVDALRRIEDQVNQAGAGMADAFGPVGAVLADLTRQVAGYARAQEEAAVRTAEAIRKAGSDQAEVDRITERSAQDRTRAQIDHYGDVAGAAKNLFAEQTAAYKILEAAEAAFRAYQFAMSIKALVMKGAETAATVTGAAVETAAVVGAEGVKTGATLAGTAARIPAKVAEGAASMFAALGPLGFVAVGAMVAVLAALGFSGGGGASRPAPALPQTNRGTGTVLGNASDPSESLAKSLEMTERYWNRDLDYSSKMVTSLRAIQTNIGSLTTAIAREMNVGGALDTAPNTRGPQTSGGFLGLFRTTSSSNVVGAGADLGSGELADLITRGVTGALYQIVQTTRTTSGFLGIGGGTRTTNNETRTGLDSEMSAEFSRVLASLRAGVLTAAGQLGVTGAEAVLDTLRITLGRISFNGMNSSEINAALNAVFSAAGDDMARAVMPGLESFQRAGEGLLETLTRLATGYQVVDQVMTLLGRTFGPIGVGSIEARERLIEFAGGLEAFAESADFFAQNFLTEAQRIAPIQASVAAELARLGIASDISRSQFADLVMGLDVSTEAGAAMYAALMALAPALDQVLTYTEETTGVVGNAMDLARERRELELRLMEAQGRISEALAARRADELAAMDASLRPLQEAIWAQEDLAAAAQELAAAELAQSSQAAAVARERRSLEIQLLEAQGRVAEALAARREEELASLDAALRPTQLAIYAAQDLARAQQDLADAQDEATREADRLAAEQARIGQQRTALEMELLESTGRGMEALNLRRQAELEALDESLRPTQEAIYAAQDLARAQAELAAATEAATAAAEREATLERERAEVLARTAGQRRSMEIELLEAQGRNMEALTMRRNDELDALDASLRPLQIAIWATLDLADAQRALAAAQEEAAAQAEREAERLAALALTRSNMEIELLEAQGRAHEALGYRRTLELAALDESLRPLQIAIHAAQDLAAAAAELAAEQERAAAAAAELAAQEQALASQRRGLDIQLLEATGQATAALAARREDELAALDASLRPLQLAVWAALDLAAANELAAQAQADAAAAAEELAAAAAALAEQRTGLELELLRVTGRETEALAISRERELAALDASLRPIQLAIWAAIDQAAANDALAASAQAAAEAAAQVAAAEAALADQRRGLDIQLLEAQGDAMGALAARRADELEALDASLRPLQSLIWATQDLAAAREVEAAAADAAAEAARALAAQRRGLDIALLEATGDAVGALAARRADELAALDPSLRALQAQIYAAQDLAAANEAAAVAQQEAAQAAEELAQRAAALASQQRGLEIQLLEATGNAAGALAARRADELAAMDASLRPLQEAIFAALDLAAANEAAATAQRAAADAAEQVRQAEQALASQRRGLDIQLMEATGDLVGAVAARRQDELAALDPTLQALQRQIYAALDLAAASDQAAAAIAASAEQARALASQQRSLDIQLMEAQGNAVAALAAKRADELAALDASLRGTQEAIYAAQDQTAAQAAAAEAARQAADQERQIATQRRQLEIQLMRESGNVSGALAATREDEVKALDASLRAVQLAIYAAQDQAAANQAAAEAYAAAQQAAEEAAASQAQRVSEARSVLERAYQAEAGALQQVIDKFGSFSTSLRAFRDSLGAADDSTASYASLRANFLRTANLARLGDEAALASLQGSGQAFLDSSAQNASSNVAYQRDIAAVRAAVDAAIGTADRGATNAQRQLEALQGSVSGLITVNESVLSVREAIRDLVLVMGGRAPIGAAPVQTGGATYQPDFSPVPLTTTGANPIGLADPADLVAEVRSLRLEVSALRAEQMAGHTSIATNTGKTARQLERWDGDGLPEERDAA